MGRATDRSERDLGSRAGRRTPRLVVGIGASAGGFAACRQLLENVPPQSGIAWIVILHLDPTHESHLDELLSRATEMDVVQVTSDVHIAADCVYVIGPNSTLELRGDVLRPTSPRGGRLIDVLLSSLADDQGARAAGVILSGMGNDGSAGLADLKAAGGLCVVQDPETAEHDAMPRSAIATGVADHVLPPAEIAQMLCDHAEQRGAGSGEGQPESSSEQQLPREIEAILARLAKRYGLDFRSYRRPTLVRRARRRMDVLQIDEWSAYLSYLDTHPEELQSLYNDVLIGVTRFFRDAEVWSYLEENVIPRIVAKLPKKDEAGVRVWVPGCATGEEAYSLAMIFLEQLEALSPTPTLRVFASDVDDRALAFARRGIYPESIADNVPLVRLQRFFHREGEGLQVVRELRDAVTFARHDVLSDPPFSQLDLVSCRNLLIYLQQSAQESVLGFFQYALRPGGWLLLGTSEGIGKRTDLFEPVSKPLRLFCARTSVRPRLAAVRQRAQPRPLGLEVPAPTSPPRPGGDRLIEQLILSRHIAPCVVIDKNLEIRRFYGRTQDYLVQPTGEPRTDLLSWARPGLYPRLKVTAQEAIEKSERVERDDLRIERDDGRYRVACTVEPIRPYPTDEPLFLVVFRDIKEAPAAEAPLPPRGEPEEPLLRQVEEELRETRIELQNTVENLETTNEEYRASHEELLSLNEELQSSNEELETSKEELQSLNEEMVTINRQLEEKNAELNTLNTHLQNLLVSTEIPTIFLNKSFKVRWFSPAATDVMRIVPSDVGRSIEHIKERVQDADLVSDATQVLRHLTPMAAEVSTPNGRWYARKILPYRTDDDRIDGVCIVFNDITAQKKAAAESEEARVYAEKILRTLRTPLVVLSQENRVLSANRAFYEQFQVSEQETADQNLYELGNGQWDIPDLRNLLEKLLPGKFEIRDYDVAHEFEHIGWRSMRLNAMVMDRPEDSALILLSIEDVTDLKKAERAAQERTAELSQEHRRKDEFLAMLGHELRNPIASIAHGLELLGATEDSAQTKRVRDMMVRETRRISRQLDELLDVSRVITGKIHVERKPLDLAALAEAAREDLAPLLDENERHLEVSLPPRGEVFVEGDEVRLSQIFENLLTNAVKYTEEGDHIWLEVEPEEDVVNVRVRDDGIGMDTAFLSNVFDLFTQAPRTLARSKGGMGLGLPLVRRLVEKHGGTATASSPGLGLGSEFVVTLPRLRRPPPARPREGAAPSEKAPVPERRILLVDDEELAAEMLAELLRIQKHDVEVVHNGKAAVAAARAFHPDVVFLDLGLPEMDGYEVARRLRNASGDGPADGAMLIALTGYDADEALLRGAGFDGYLLKPPDMEKLYDYLRAAGRAAG